MYIGIDSNTGLVYDGWGHPNVPVIPTPHITLATLIKTEEDWRSLPTSFDHSSLGWIFREDTFDAVTRTRRGRLYFQAEGSQPTTTSVTPHPYEDPFGRSAGQGGLTRKTLYTYMACTPLLQKAKQGQGSILALGTAQAASAWRVVQTEILVCRNVMVTLKALSTFDILPEIDMTKVSTEHQNPVKEAFDRALDSAFRETSISVIDHCKNAIAVIVARWLVQQGHDKSVLSKDIGDVAKAVLVAPYKMFVIGNLAQVTARLHARGKGNEQHAKEARLPTEEDAQLALETLGVILRDIGWAKN
jgi:hypothetical protein